jgi:hypothetical protein
MFRSSRRDHARAALGHCVTMHRLETKIQLSVVTAGEALPELEVAQMSRESYLLPRPALRTFRNRQRTLQVVLVFVGLICVAGVYPLVGPLLDVPKSDTVPQDQMILSIYIALGVFLPMAVRNPAAHRSLILFAAWGTLAHDAVMVIQQVQRGSRGDLPAFAFIALLCVVLVALAPAKQPLKPSSISAPCDE